MIAVQDACVSGQWLTAIILSLCCFLPSCLPAGQTVDYSSVESVVSRQGDTALLRGGGQCSGCRYAGRCCSCDKCSSAGNGKVF
ncbi:neuronal growth regulator 1 isoform X1 [Lates japonicus]|uniref:Neuronal growth regulator 1 isoform X1 n=1 Tax=Lates japonicus TaxID=270547 RepID=A0AAD3MA34_LATJO|nr:neuronal growth regulator 1 isoform X1 [Lates japonicus]